MPKFVPPSGKGVKRAARMPFADWLQVCTPAKWSLRVWSTRRTVDGEQIRRNIAVPEDRNATAALARDGFPAGSYKVRALFRGARGAAYDQERGRCGLRPRQEVEVGLLVVTQSAAEVPPEPTTAAGGVQAAREAAMRAKHEAEAEEQRAVMAEAKARRIKAERAAQLDAEPPAAAAPPAADIAGIVQLLLAQQQQQQQLLLQMLEQTRTEAAQREQRMLQLMQQQAEAPAAAAPPASLQGILEQLKLLREVKEAFADDDDGEREPEPDSIFGLVRQLRELMPQQQPLPHVNRLPHSNGAAAAAHPSPSAAPPAAAADPATPAAPIGQARVQQFVQLLLQEYDNGSDPGAVAEQLDAAIGLLPAAVRGQLERGDWSAAWGACRPHLPADAFAALDGVLSSSPDAQGWCLRFAESCVLEEEEA